MHAPTHAQKHLEVWQIVRTNQTFDYSFLLFNSPVFDQDMNQFLCYYTHTAAIDYQIEVTIEVTLVNILVLKAIDST